MTLIKPQPKQAQFLTSQADIALYGGSAGGGKSFSLLLSPLYYLDNPKFNAVFFRRTMVDIKNPGGLWDESKNIYYHVNGHPQEQSAKWTFPSKAIIKFAHLEYDSSVYSWQGAAINLLIFDELTHFTDAQFWYLLSRNRSVSGIKPLVRASTNPDKDCWVRRLISWWIGKDGFPIPERSGVLRWFIRSGGDLVWADSADELLHRQSDLPIEKRSTPKSFTFISAKLTDNQILMRANPEYLSNLMAQNPVERAKLLDGNWDISYSDFGAVLNRTDFQRYQYLTDHKGNQIFPMFEKTYFVIDGASKVKEANDYSVIGFFGKTKVDQQYYIIDWFRCKLEAPELEQKIIDMWFKWKPQLSPQGIWIEDASVGISLIQHLQRRGLPVFPLKPIKDKFLRLNDSLGTIKSKYVHVPAQAEWVEKFFQECECFRGDLDHVVMENEKMPHDDQVDCLAYGLGNQITVDHFVSVYKPKDQNKKRVSAIWKS